ncbi:MAG: S8 family serine peptidase [Anaerolineales bacterium]
MKRVIIILAAFALVGALFGAPSTATASQGSQSYLILARGNALPNGLSRAVARAGGEVTATMPEIGLAVAESGSASFADALSRNGQVRSVVPNVELQWVDPVEVHAGPEAGNPPASGEDDLLFDLQWGHDAVDAPEAWEEGLRGSGASVAVLDTGFDLEHPDLAPNINFALSKDFTGEGLQYTLGDVFSHGTHTAGTVAAADNAIGTIGVAPEAELILVKVLGDEGSGTFADVIAGIVYAANSDADVISMSLGARLDQSGFVDTEGNFVSAQEVAELRTAIGRATSYAHRQGSTVIASAGNDAEDYDHAGPILHLPSDAPHVISIAATGPEGWALDPDTDLDTPAFYTNYGQSVIDFAAPGGDVDFDLLESGDICTVGVVTVDCYVFDLVFSTGNGGWYWAAGTSMSAPHAAGVAALVIGDNGGSMQPAQVEAALRQLADDLGKPGKDDFYGLGRIDATNSGE